MALGGLLSFSSHAGGTCLILMGMVNLWDVLGRHVKVADDPVIEVAHAVVEEDTMSFDGGNRFHVGNNDEQCRK